MTYRYASVLNSSLLHIAVSVQEPSGFLDEMIAILLSVTTVSPTCALSNILPGMFLSTIEAIVLSDLKFNDFLKIPASEQIYISTIFGLNLVLSFHSSACKHNIECENRRL